MAIRAVVFDMDGTVNVSRKYYEAYNTYAIPVLADFLNLSNEEVQSKMNALRGIAIGFTKRVELMGMPRSAFYKEMAARVPCKDLIRPDPHLEVMLRELKTMGYKLGLLTNTGRPLVDKIMDALEFSAKLWDATVTSTETGLKPDDEPYIYVANKLGLMTEECAYVGDRYEMEIATAKKLGMTTILLGNSLLEDSTRKGHSDYTVDSIYSIPAILRDTREKKANLATKSNSLRAQIIPLRLVSLLTHYTWHNA